MRYFVLLILSFQIFAQDTFDFESIAIVRNKKFKAKATKVKLINLISNHSFDGKYFKIVLGKEETPISFDSDAEILLKASTVYYHLNKARDYFLNDLESDYVANLPKLTIRLELKNKFNELGHFANDNLEPQYNNALSIPAGSGFPSRGVMPWNMEIWFRPVKKINIKDLNLKDDSIKEFDGVLRQFRQQIHMQSLQRFFVSLANSNRVPLFPTGNVTFDAVFRLVGASVIMEAGYQSIDFLNNLLRRKNYWLDTALVPEIIYHEFAHVALSDRLKLTHSTPVNEGIADYFAGAIADSPKLANKIKKYNTFSGKNAKNKKLYMIQFETMLYANTDFVFGLLWSMKDILGEKEANKFIYRMRDLISTNSPIRDQLLQAILDTCRESCKNPATDRIKLLKLFNSKGL